MSLFQELIHEWNDVQSDDYLDEIFRMVEEKMSPEPGVHDYDKFHGAVSKAQRDIRAHLAHVTDPKTRFKSRLHKQQVLQHVHKRLGKVRQASWLAHRFATKMGKEDHAKTHLSQETELGHRQTDLSWKLGVEGAKKGQRTEPVKTFKSGVTLPSPSGA